MGGRCRRGRPRSSNAKASAAQEPWAWGAEVEGSCRRSLELRYRLLPYLYTCMEAAHRTGTPVLRPLWWHHPTEAALRRLQDEAYVGPDLLVAPILQPGKVARAVHLPPGSWYDWRTSRRVRGDSDVMTSAALGDVVPLYVRAGAIIPTAPSSQWSDQCPLDPLVLEVFPDADGTAEGRFYEDDGTTYGFERGDASVTHLHWDGAALGHSRCGTYDPGRRSVVVHVHLDGVVQEHQQP